jgi:hypothetical protein
VRILITAVALGSVACSAAQPTSVSFNVLLKDDGHTWCAYKNQDEFKADAAALKPTESVRITYQATAITELTYQVDAESGDWIVIDTYTPSNGALHLKRANLMVQPISRSSRKPRSTTAKPAPFTSSASRRWMARRRSCRMWIFQRFLK